MANSEFALEMGKICKEFTGVKALDNVSLQVKKGTVHALMGENGAGKSTLMKCAFGIYSPDSGEMFVNGEGCVFNSSRNAMDKGISMIHQELHPIKFRSVMENIWAGRIPTNNVLGMKLVNHKKMYDDTIALFDKLDIKHIDPRKNIGEYSASSIQLVEIARAVSFDAKVIIMDEPTSSLTSGETERLFEIIRNLTKKGTAIIYISHKIEEILKISDEVTIMRDGKLIGCWKASELTEEAIVNRMVGREMTQRFPSKTNTPSEPYLVVKNLTSVDPRSFKDISFEVCKGEILGIGGLVGAQRTELVEAIFGLRGISSGEIYIDNKQVKIKSPNDAIDNGIALLTEERRASGIFPVLSITENTVIASLKKYKNQFGLLKVKECKRDTKKYINSLSIKTPSTRTLIGNLSGGNQQKVLIARWLLTNPDIFIMDEPTRGIDVGAKYEIYKIMIELASQGKCIIMISSEMPEMLGLADRIMVMCEGRLSGIFSREEASEEKIMQLASKFIEAEENKND